MVTLKYFKMKNNKRLEKERGFYGLSNAINCNKKIVEYF